MQLRSTPKEVVNPLQEMTLSAPQQELISKITKFQELKNTTEACLQLR